MSVHKHFSITVSRDNNLFLFNIHYFNKLKYHLVCIFDLICKTFQRSIYFGIYIFLRLASNAFELTIFNNPNEIETTEFIGFLLENIGKYRIYKISGFRTALFRKVMSSNCDYFLHDTMYPNKMYHKKKLLIMFSNICI